MSATGVVYSERVTLEKHRDSLTKYCYDLSKLIIAVAVVNPLVSKPLDPLALMLGIVGSMVFLVLAILVEKGKSR